MAESWMRKSASESGERLWLGPADWAVSAATSEPSRFRKGWLSTPATSTGLASRSRMPRVNPEPLAAALTAGICVVEPGSLIAGAY